jgi:Calx-beta domain-containing protein
MLPKPSAISPIKHQNKEFQMETVFSRTVNMTLQVTSMVNRPAFRRIACVVATLVSGFVLLSGNLVTRKVESRPAVAIRAAGRGLPYLNPQDGRELSVSYGGDSRSASALQNGTTRSRALAVADLDGDAAPDLVAGYTNGASGIVTIQKGNPEGFAPKDDSVFVRMQQGYNPDSLLPTVETFPVSSPVDFLQLGDFNQDGRKDVLVATRDGNLLLLPGDGQGGLGAEEQIKIPGTVTALTTGEFRAADGRTDVAVAINGEAGPEVLIFDGAAGGFDAEPFRYPLAGRSIGLEFGELDSDPFMDLAVVAGSEIEIVHGWGRKVAKQANMQVERVQLGFAPQSIAVDNFTWDREGTREIALLAEDGAVHLLENSRSDKRPLTASDLAARAAMRGNVTNKNVDVEVVQGWKNAGSGKWREINQLSLNARTKNGAATQALLVHGKISTGETNALMIVNEAQQALQVVHQARGNNTSSQDVLTGDLSTTTLEATDTPTAVVALPKKLNGVRDLVMLQDSRPTPVNISIEPLATFGVNTTSDHAPDGACNASPDCTFREAVIAANASAGPDTINLPAGTYTLTIIGNTNNAGAGEGFTGNPAIGDVDFRDSPDPNQNPGNGDATTVSGAGSGTTFIVQSTANDRVLEPNPNGDLNFDWTISGVTIAGGRDTGGVNTGGGGGALSGSKDNLTTITNCVWANNRATGSGGSGGGGLSNQGGTVVVTNTVFGGAVTVAACPSQTATNCGNNTVASGGGIAFSPGDPFGRTPSAGTLTIQTTSSFLNNTGGSAIAGGGAGADLYTHNLGTGSVSISNTTFTSNLATNFGGGVFVESIATTISATSFTNNSAGVRGGGIQVAGGSLLLDGTSPSITFTGNTATTAGSSISTSSAVNLSGTNTTIGGDLEITTNGVWTNNVGSTMSPNNLIIIGTGSFTANNSTTNVSGNFQFQSGTFNAGTGLFNFNGTGSQTINNSVAITFNNLTDSNVNQQLTINNNIAVNGTLNMNGAATVLNPLAGTVVSGSGTLNGSGTVRVTRTAATADFLSQYTITNKTLTNLLVDYVGAAAQVLSSITYSGGLRINNASGVTSAAGTATVDGVLTLTAGALNVNTSTLVINNGSSVAAGSITSAATGTVNYNQGSAGQNVLAFNYGNLTFSNQNKVLASTGTIGIAGVFTPGTAVGHTITGSTINFNGAGAQTIPAFNYNNLTSSNAGARTLANAGTIGVAGAFTPGGNTYTITGSTIDYNGSGAQTISAFNYNNLTSSNSGARTLINGGTIGIAGVFTPGGNAYTITGNTINFNGAGAQTIPAFNYNNLTSSNAGARTLANAGTIGVAGAFTPGGNTYTITGSTIDFNGAGPQTIPAFNYNNLTSSNTGARTLANAGTIGIAAVFTPGTNAYTITGSTIDFNGAGAQTIPAFNYNNLTSSNAGARTLANSGNIGIAGVFTPGGNAYTITGSTVVFNGSAPQTLPPSFTTYNNLTLNNAAGVTGFAGLTVQGLLRVQAGAFTSSSTYNNVQIDAGATLAGTNATTINVSGNWTNNGTYTANNNTVNFNGSGAQVIGGTNATTFQNLTIANAGSGVSLGQNATVNGVLTLTNDLTTGANVLTMPATGTSAGAGDVVGNVKRTGFITGSGNTLSFGNLNNQITINSGTVPTDITINLVKAAPSGGIAFPTAVLRTYTVTPTGGSGISATMRLRYLDTELNGNTEVGLALWRHNGAAWSRQGATTGDTTNNWVQLIGITQFSPWTLSSAKNDTTTTITADSPDPSLVGQAVPINFSVVSNVSGAPAVTGNVTITVNDVSGDTCTGALGGGGTGSCNLTLTTVGAKTLTATYNADPNFNGSSDTEPHQVVQGTVVINDGSVSEPTSGTTTMLFTVTLSAPALGGESVDFATADQVVGPGHAVAGTCGTVGVDYQANSGTLAFAAGQQVKTISVTVCSDTDNSEPDETFLVNLTNPQGGVIITDNQAVGTIKTANAAGAFLISELRTSGPAGLGDDFVEFYNNSNSPLTVAASDASAGYGVYKIGADCDAIPVLIGTIPNGTVIPARGHYLMVGSQYSLANYGGSGAATGNLTLTTDIESDRNVAVFSTANALNITSANRLDAVGFGTNIGSVCALMREGTTLPPLSGSALEYSYFRSMKPASGGNPQDTNDNLADFLFADTNATSTPAGQRLGAPGPERAPDPTNGSPIRRDNSGILVALLDGTVSSTVGPNRVRNFASILPNYPNGSLEVRRRVQNNTGGPVTRLRFRIVEMTTGPTPPVGTADLRAITSAAATVSVNDPVTCSPSAPPCMVTAQVTTLETPPAQANGGGYNATLSVGTITMGTPLANGASALVNFQLGVKQGGTFRFLIIVEALP